MNWLIHAYCYGVPTLVAVVVALTLYHSIK